MSLTSNICHGYFIGITISSISHPTHHANSIATSTDFQDVSHKYIAVRA
jgi:hypothetical protein